MLTFGYYSPDSQPSDDDILGFLAVISESISTSSKHGIPRVQAVQEGITEIIAGCRLRLDGWDHGTSLHDKMGIYSTSSPLLLPGLILYYLGNLFQWLVDDGILTQNADQDPHQASCTLSSTAASHQCTILGCHKWFKTPELLVRHVKKLHEFTPRLCPKLGCPSTELFSTKTQYVAHVLTHGEPMACPQPGCDKKFCRQDQGLPAPACHPQGAKAGSEGLVRSVVRLGSAEVFVPGLHKVEHVESTWAVGQPPRQGTRGNGGGRRPVCREASLTPGASASRCFRTGGTGLGGETSIS